MPHLELDLDHLGGPSAHQQASDTPSASSDVSQRQLSYLDDYDSHHYSFDDDDHLDPADAYASALDFALESPSEINTAAVAADDPSASHGFKPPPLSIAASSAAAAIQQRSARSQTVSVVTHNLNPTIKRKPLSPTASALAVRYSSSSNIAASLDPRPSRSQSLDTPARAFRDSGDLIPSIIPASLFSGGSSTTYPEIPANLVEVSSRNIPQPRPAVSQTESPDALYRGHKEEKLEEAVTVDTPHNHNRNHYALDAHPEPILEEGEFDRDNDTDGSTYSVSDYNSDNDNTTQPTPIVVEQRPSSPAPSLDRVDSGFQATATVTTVTRAQISKPLELNKPLPQHPSPKSPVLTKFGTFFTWGSTSPSNTEFSSIPSPVSPRPTVGTDDTTIYSSRTDSNASDKARANAATENPLGYCESYLHTPPPPGYATPSPPTSVEIEEMEDELKAISAELASSIRRELDLEMLVDRLQTEVNNPQAPGKRTSDYFSDSGISSAKFSEFDQNKEEVEKVQRRADQEKAQLRLELTTKVQDERSKRRELDAQIKVLSERASQIDLAQVKNRDASGRLQELENTCDDLRRRLSEERQVKDNFEDLLSVLKEELQTAANERDNLRDEVVPQLRARVEGLETQATDFANLTYESTKMQQELQTLKTENTTLRKSKAEVESRPGRQSGGLARSSSVTSKPFKLQQPPSGLSRSNTVKNNVVESRDVLSDRLKDVEAQRDALHNALKNLLERQEFQNRENEKKIKILEMERDRLMGSLPKKAGYETDISNLRHEIKVLRRRAEDAIDQKWQVEKGLVGLKMDLDRAEEEIASLRALLEEKDILIPPSLRSSHLGSFNAVPVSSETLERAYRELQDSYAEALERIKKLEAEGVTKPDEKTQLALERLEMALTSAVTDRDGAKAEAEAYRVRLDDVTASEAQHLEAERSLSEELGESARRVEELAAQVRSQLAANTGLREKLSQAVTKGDAERKANAQKVTGLQSRLKTLEDQLIAAQTASEDRVARHEEELMALREAQNSQLRRVSSSPVAGGLRSPGLYPSGLRSPGRLSPMPSPLFPRSPKLVPAKTLDDDAEVSRLRDRVNELEQALAQADREMQEVVATMSAAQIEVLTLQEEREKAVRETRKLQQVIDDERVKAFEDKFKTLARSGTVA